MKAKNKFIVINPIVQDENKDSSGFMFSSEDVSKMRYQKAVVIATGDKVDINLDGQTILYDKNHTFEALVDDKLYTIIQEGGVIAVL